MTDPVQESLAHLSIKPPISAHWDITWRCDHSCIHCYLVERRQDELSFEEGSQLLHDLAELGVMFLLISGGDPFLRPDALDIIRLAKKLNFDVAINTHGNFIDDAVADELADLGVSVVALSLYSGEAEDHEAVTRIKGSFQKTVDAAKRMRNRGVKVALKSPVTRHNAHTIDQAEAIAQSMDASHYRDAHLLPDDQGDFEMMSIRPDRETRIYHVMKTMDGHREQILAGEIGAAPSHAGPCQAGRSALHIAPNGKIYSCVQLQDEAGDWRTTSLKDIWYNSPALNRIRAVNRASYLVDCEGCAFHEVCDYCPANSYNETGDPGRRSAHTCESTHINMSAMEYVKRLAEANQPLPDLGSPELNKMFEKSTFADRQWAARKAKFATQGDYLTPNLVQIGEPRSTL